MDLRNKTIVFQGDSITDMNRERNNFDDKNHLYGHSFVFLLASYFGCEMPEYNITVHNRGVSGQRSTGLKNVWQKDAIDLKPDLISILIGINDVAGYIRCDKELTCEKYENSLVEIIEETKAKLPDTKLIICEPFAFVEAADEIYQKDMPRLIRENQEAARRVAERFDCLFIPLQEVFDKAVSEHPELGHKHWIWDGIHPTAAGHRIIAKQWMKYVTGNEAI